MSENESPAVDVRRLSLPLTLVIAALAAVIPGAVVWGHTANRVTEHVDDGIRHLDASAVVRGGGVAYQTDVRGTRDELTKELRALRADLRSLRGSCHRIPGDGMECVFVVPEQK